MADRDSGKKQKVLHTRVSADLERDLKSRATQLGVSVSNLVRNTLLNTVDLVETVVADSARVADSAKNLAEPGAHRSPPSPSPSPLGWQEVTLNLNAVCAKCNQILPRGERAAFALPLRPDAPQTRCLPCLPSATQPTPERSP